VIGRIMAQELSKSLNQQVVPDNRSGDSGNIGADMVAKSPADGYTLLLAALTSHAINTGLNKDGIKYNLEKDFSPVGVVGVVPLVFVVNPSVPVNNMKEFIAYAKSKPIGMNGATTGIGTTQHLANVLFAKAGGFKSEDIHYAGSAPALQDLIAGRDDFMFDSLLTRKYVADGRLKALAVSSAQRSPYAPELPTMIESGLPGFDVSVWFAILAPSKTPSDIVAKVNADIRQAMSSKDVQDRLSAASFEYIYNSSPSEFSTMVKREHERWTKVVREAGIKSE
jgi:tripartite-type tricarboxylate transporter receptor subunit TctC